MTEFELLVAQMLTAENEDDKATAEKELCSLLADREDIQRKSRLDSEIRRTLLELGVPDSLKGHRALMSALRIAVENPNILNAVTKGLYPAVAAECGTTATRVERSIRHAIETGWDRCDFDTRCEYFGNTVNPNKGKPVNSEYISRVANAIRARNVEYAL